jgi:hypothetical protein
MKRIGKLIKKSKFQKGFYLVILLVYDIPFLVNTIKYLNVNSSIGIPNYYLLIIPTVILLYQIIYNNFWGWLLFIFLYFVFFVFLGISVYSGIIEDSDNYSFESYLLLSTIFILYLAFGFFLLILKPTKNE